MYDFLFNNNKYKILLTKHLYEKRHKYARNALLTDTAIIKTIKSALINGLTSFRNKGKVKVHVMVFDGSSMTLLLSLDNFTITVISAYKTRSIFYNVFITVTQRIFISDYIIPKMTKNERNKHNMKNSFKLTDMEKDMILWSKYKKAANNMRLV